MDTKKACYRADDRLRDIIDDNNNILLVMSRFAIPMGFGDNKVGQICRENDVDTATFLAVANLISGHTLTEQEVESVALPSLMRYLRQAHSYFLDFILPTIRRKLIEAINYVEMSDVAFLILKFYDDYVVEVRRHMEHENNVIFPYIDRLIQGQLDPKMSMAHFAVSHESMVEKLNELKDIVIRHYRQESNHMLTYVLYDIINCENDLMSHCEVEDTLLAPATIRLEDAVKAHRYNAVPEEHRQTPVAEKIEALSDREKDVVRCVARGMANKEIADALCLSVHTVTTYRRNIASKLQIHSPAGLTIFAIINRLIDIKDIKLQ